MNNFEWSIIKEEVNANVIGQNRKAYILRRIRERVFTLSKTKGKDKNGTIQ
jgi:hypothetical protein